MLKMVEYGILAVSLLMVLGLITSNSRSSAAPLQEGLDPDAGAAPLGSVPLPEEDAGKLK